MKLSKNDAVTQSQSILLIRGSRPLSSQKSHNRSSQLFSKEKRDPQNIPTYCSEYEHDLVNREGPGPAAF